jgi:hypothetical protein
VNIVLRRYSRALKEIFKRYSGSGYYKHSVSKKETFELATRTGTFLLEAEFFKALRDHSIAPKLITKDQFG